MLLLPILLIAWPFTLAVLALVVAAILHPWPEHYDYVWLLPRSSSLRPANRR